MLPGAPNPAVAPASAAGCIMPGPGIGPPMPAGPPATLGADANTTLVSSGAMSGVVPRIVAGGAGVNPTKPASWSRTVNDPFGAIGFLPLVIVTFAPSESRNTVCGRFQV